MAKGKINVNAAAKLEDAMGYYEMGKSCQECENLTGINLKRVEREAKKRGLSRGNLVELVENKVAIDVQMSKMTPQTRYIVENEAQIRQKHIEFFNNAALSNVKNALAAGCEGQSDHRHLSATIKESRETVLGKQADVAIQINNNIRLEDLLADI